MDAQEKIARLEVMVQEDPMDSLTHFMLGREYLETEQYENAAKSLKTCTELNPEYTAAYRFMGDAYRKNGQDKEAIAAYQLGIGVASRTGDLQAGKEMNALLSRIEGAKD